MLLAFGPHARRAPRAPWRRWAGGMPSNKSPHKLIDQKMRDPLAGLEEAVVAKGSDLLRTIPAFPVAPADDGEGAQEAGLADIGPSLWTYPEHAKDGSKDTTS